MHLERKRWREFFSARERWIAEGEKITVCFCGFEKRNYVCRKLTLNSGEEILETKDSINKVKTFYERLYSDRQLADCETSDLVEDILH